MRKENKAFTIEHTNIIKGIAVIILLFYHIIYTEETEFPNFLYSCWAEAEITDFFRRMGARCAEIFAILSGYGMVKSADKYVDKYKEKISGRFSVQHILKILFSFWFVFVVFVPLGYFFHRNPIHIYGTGVSGWMNLVWDFLGISELTGTPTINETWWYMGGILKCYFFFPVMYYGVKNNIFSMATFWILASCLFEFRLERAFVLGMMLSEKDIMTKYVQMSFWKKTLALISLGFVAFLQYYRGIARMPMVFFIILGVVSAISVRSLLGKGLVFLGKHSGNIFMFHTFIYLYYFKDFIYGFRYPILIFMVLLSVCVIASVVLEGVKKILRYEKAEAYVKQKCLHFKLGKYKQEG